MKGFILIYTFFILLAIAILSLCAIQMMSSQFKGYRLRKAQMAAHLELQKIQRTIKHSLHHRRRLVSAKILDQIRERNEGFACKILPQFYGEISHQPFTFWQHKACHGSGDWVDYYFVIELLSHQDCAKIGTELGVDFFRVTMLAILKSFTSNLMWQWTIATPSKLNAACPESIRDITPGLQSQRELFWTG